MRTFSRRLQAYMIYRAYHRARTGGGWEVRPLLPDVRTRRAGVRRQTTNGEKSDKTSAHLNFVGSEIVSCAYVCIGATQVGEFRNAVALPLPHAQPVNASCMANFLTSARTANRAFPGATTSRHTNRASLSRGCEV